jgi:rubrerythrin
MSKAATSLSIPEFTDHLHTVDEPVPFLRRIDPVTRQTHSTCYKPAVAGKDRCARMSKQSMREEAERLIRETMARRTIVVKQGNTRIEAVCGKCGAPNRVSAEKGATRVKFACKQCGHKQETL